MSGCGETGVRVIIGITIVSVIRGGESGLATRRRGLLGGRLLLFVIILALAGEKGIDGGRDDSSDGKYRERRG